MPRTRSLTGLANDEPLVTTSERFALGRLRYAPVRSDEPASAVGVRPFGLRFAAPPSPGVAVPGGQYSADRQLAIMPDGQPWYLHIADMTMRTTGPSPDGGGSMGGEEYTPDFLSDEASAG